MNIEIERKFLLKAIPNKKPIEKIEIFQWYLKNSEGIWERARSCYSNINGFYFTHTIKKSIAPCNSKLVVYLTSNNNNQIFQFLFPTLTIILLLLSYTQLRKKEREIGG